MAKLREFSSFLLPLLLMATIFFAGCASATEEDTHKVETPRPEEAITVSPTPDPSTAKPITASTRSGRVMKVLKDPKSYVSVHRDRAPPPPPPPPPVKLRARIDRMPGPGGKMTHTHGPLQRIPITYIRYHPHMGGMPGPGSQIVRRIQSGNGGGGNGGLSGQRYAAAASAADPAKSSRYSVVKKVPGPPPSPSQSQSPYGDNKMGSYRPQYASSSHPNAVSGGRAPSPGNQQPQQQQQSPYTISHNFKASPLYNGKAIVRPVPDAPQYGQQSYHHHHSHDIQQYPIPDETPQKYADMRETFAHQIGQREKYASPGFGGATDDYQTLPYQRKEQTPLLQPQNHANRPSIGGYQHGPSTKQQQQLAQQSEPIYAVYEDNETNDRDRDRDQTPAQHRGQPLTFNHNYQSSSTTESPLREAHEYLKFMNSNEYFLPKRDPNYKKIDEENDRRQYRVQQKQQQIYYGKSPSVSSPSVTSSSSSSSSVASVAAANSAPVSSSASVSAAAASATSFNNQPIEVSQLFYQHDPSPNSAIVRGSYQAGANAFLANSGKSPKQQQSIGSTIAPATPTTPAYTHLRYGNAGNNGIATKSRTPEPVRFEFTERDAMPSTYTNSPLGQQNQHHYHQQHHHQQQHQQHQQQQLAKSSDYVLGPSTQRSPLNVQSANAPLTYGSGSGSGIIGTSTTVTKSAGGFGTSGLRPVNESEPTDDDPEDGEDMQEASSDIYGRVPVHSTSPSPSQPQPPSEQKDTEEYCERICANVQDDDEEVVCGSDGFMYVSEAQMECYASCLHIDVTIQGKGSCTAR